MSNFLSFLVLGLSIAATACENRKAEVVPASASAAITASVASATEASGRNATAKVAKIVFIGKEQPCNCTRKKIETAQAALQKLLGEPTRIPVETFQADTQEDQVEPYRKMQPMMALPAIYFVDEKGGLVEMLQGEITEGQVSKVLGALDR